MDVCFYTQDRDEKCSFAMNYLTDWHDIDMTWAEFHP